MHFIRRAAFRAASSPSTSICKPRSITTSSPFALRSKTKNGIPSTVFKRLASDDANSSQENSSVESADSDDHGAIRSAIDSATESASTYARDAAGSLTGNAERAKDGVAGGAAATAAGLGFDSRSLNGQRPVSNDRTPYRGDRGDRGGFGGNRSGEKSGAELRDIRERPQLTPCPSIYVGNLLFDVTAIDLEREFGEFGTIKRATVAADVRGLSKGFGYIEFETTEQAKAAIEAKHETVYEGRRLIVNFQSQTRRENRINQPSKTLFIGNIAFEMSDADLNKLFREIRNVIDVRVAIDRRTGQPRGFAHADFIDVDSATKALEQLQDKEVYGRKLRCDYSTGGFASARSATRNAEEDRQ